MEGRIIRIISNLYTVKSKDKSYLCSLRGKFRLDKITPLVGDFVSFDEDTKCIEEIHKRKNELIRPRVANVDQVMIITSATNPEFSTLILDKFLAIIEYNKIKPVICLTKLDLLSKKEKKDLNKTTNYYKKLGYKVINNKQLFRMRILFENKVTVFTGQSGVGKSTLINKLKKDLNIKTGEVSNYLKRGKNTTRHVELYEMFNGLVCDTPGFSSLDLIDMSLKDIRNSFKEFKTKKCKYKDCMNLIKEDC